VRSRRKGVRIGTYWGPTSPSFLKASIMAFIVYENASVRRPQHREATGIRRGSGDVGKAGWRLPPIRGSGTSPRIEAIIYEKLKVYDILLPEGSVHTWQPPQAFEALVAIEPGAEDTYTYAIAPQREFGKIAEGSYRAVGVAPRASGLRRRGTNSEHIYMRNGRLRALLGHGPRPGRFWRRRWRTSRLW
jgi:hypothetical protein